MSSSSSSSRSTLAIAAAAATTAAAAFAYYRWSSNSAGKTSKATTSTRSGSGSGSGSVDGATAAASSTSTVPALIQQRFEQCALHIKKSPPNSISQSIQLELYGFYKQATMGDCSIDQQPPKYDLVATAKYKAWKQHAGMDRTTAMQAYIDKAVWLEFTKEMDQNDIDYSKDEDDEDDDDKVMNISGMGNRPSTLMTLPGDDDDNEEHDNDNADDTNNKKSKQRYPLHAAAQSNDLETLKHLLLSSKGNDDTIDVMKVDSTGQTALHLAADRGHLEAAKLLLQAALSNATDSTTTSITDRVVNAKDQDGISVLQAAVIGGNVDVCQWLLEQGANPDQPDADGDTPRQCANDDQALKELFQNWSSSNNNTTTITTNDGGADHDNTILKSNSNTPDLATTPTKSTISAADDSNDDDKDDDEEEDTPKKTNTTKLEEDDDGDVGTKPLPRIAAALQTNLTMDTSASEDANDLQLLDYIPMELDDDGDM